MPVDSQMMPGCRRPDARARARRHRWMLLLAFEVLVFGFAQAVLRPIEPPGVTVEQTVTPNHVVT